MGNPFFSVDPLKKSSKTEKRKAFQASQFISNKKAVSFIVLRRPPYKSIIQV